MERDVYKFSKIQKQFPSEETLGFIIDQQDTWLLHVFLQKKKKKNTKQQNAPLLETRNGVV